MSERWLGAPAPGEADVADWSRMKYRRFIEAAGGWDAFQGVLRAVAEIAAKHEVGAANVATRWVLDHAAVAAVVVGARLGERDHADANLAAFDFALDAEDRARIDQALAGLKPIPGDCGDEYRRPPFLTASGDLSHHLTEAPRAFTPTPVEGRPGRARVSSGSAFEPIAGYSRAVRVGDRVLVSGTTATNGADEIVCPGDPAGQTTFILDKIAASLAACGASLEDVVRTRVYLVDADHWEPVSRAHGRRFGDIRPANTLLQVGRLIGDYLVEIEAEAVLDR
jgi:enamine deaminase RidA (YjgF/YER057c/UK114 family)